MLYFERTDVSEGIDVNTSSSKECDICHYSFFLNYSFKFQPNVCKRCHNFLMMFTNLLSDIAISNIKVFDYLCIINLEVINLMQNADLSGNKA